MFSSNIRLLTRSQCYRSFFAFTSAVNECHLQKAQPKFTKYLVVTNRFVSGRRNQFGRLDSKNASGEEEKKVRRKTPEIPKITLIDPKENLSVCTLEEAVKIAEGRKLRLVKITDMDLRSKRPIYKLMTEAQYLEEEIQEKKKLKEKKNKSKGNLKGEKLLMLSCRITEHDLNLKLRKAEKWVQKNFEVRVIISGPNDSMDEQEMVFKKFEEVFQPIAKFLQKRNKGSDLRFQIIPLKEALESSENVKPLKQKKNSLKSEEFDFEDLESEESNESELKESNESNESDSKQSKRNILS